MEGLYRSKSVPKKKRLGAKMQKVQGGKNSNNKTMKRFGLRIWDAMSGNVDGVKPS